MMPKWLPQLAVLCALFAAAAAGAASSRPAAPDPLRSLVEEALRSNLSFQGDRLAERRAQAD